jgi:hypothetical protein
VWLEFWWIATVLFVGDVMIGACAQPVGNTITYGALLPICESASLCDRCVRCVQALSTTNLVGRGVCLSESLSYYAGAENCELHGVVQDRCSLCVCVCVCVLAVLIWLKAEIISVGVITAILKPVK